jgi:hypothetical protein
MKVRAIGDGIDVEHLDELRVNPGYRLVTVRLDTARQTAVRELTQAKSWDETRFLQGRIAALSLALEMPDQLAKEIKGSLKPCATS